MLDDLPELEHVIVVDDREEPGVGQEIAPTAKVAVHEWDELLAVDATTPDVAVRPSDLATFIYTGGTTGPSKGCMLSHNYHEALSRQIGICWERTADDVVWTPLPLFHFNALVTAVLGSLVFGGRGAIYRRFSVSNFWPEMNRVGATITSTLGTMAYLLAHDVDRPEMPSSGAPEANTTPAAARRGAAAGRGRRPCSASASASRRSAARTASPRPASSRGSRPGVRNQPNAAGVVNDEYFDVRIFDDDDNELPHGERRRDRRPPQAAARDVRGLLGPARGDGRDAAATGGTTPATSAGSTTTASSSSSTARPTTSAAAARTSRASRSSAC